MIGCRYVLFIVWYVMAGHLSLVTMNITCVETCVCVCDWLLVKMQTEMLTIDMLTSVFVKLCAFITIVKGSEFSIVLAT